MIEAITLVNNVTNAKLELDMDTTPSFILGSVSWGQIKGSHHTYSYVGQVGETHASTTLGTRDVEIEGWIIAETPALMTQRKRILNRFVNPQQEMTLFYSDYKITFFPDSSVKYGDDYEDNNDVIVKFAIDGESFDPLFRNRNKSRVNSGYEVGMFHFPLIISETPDPPGGIVFGRKIFNYMMNVYNAGAVSTGFTVEFIANSSVVNPALINVSTQEIIKIDKTLQPGEKITVTTTIGEKSVTSELNGVVSNAFKYKSFDSSWIQLAVGDNVFRYDADDGINDLMVNIIYENRFLEVQEWN